MKRKDIFSKKKRSEIMSSIRSKNTKIELMLKEELKKHRIQFEMHGNLPGKPDFVFPKQRQVVFCHGDFWHGKNYDKMKPKLNKYWRNKIEGNMKRDKKVLSKLHKLGWHTTEIMGSDIQKDCSRCVQKIVKKLSSKSSLHITEKAWQWLCLRYHGNMSCVFIAKEYNVSRQAVNSLTIHLAQKLSEMRGNAVKCPKCGKDFDFSKIKIKTDKYDIWKKYSSSEIEYIKKNIKKENIIQMARHLKRTSSGLLAKINRMNLR